MKERNDEIKQLQGELESIQKRLTAMGQETKLKVFKGNTLQEAMDNLLKEGYRPATMKEVWDLKEKGKILVLVYDTATIFLEGEIRTATNEELKDLNKLYASGGRVLFLGISYGGLHGDSDLGSDGRFVGVKK